MRLAVVSDIHGNLTALEAVIADLKEVSPDLVVQAGDLVASGFRPAEVVDRIRQLGWPGIQGNTDEMLWRPERLSELALRAASRQGLREVLFKYIAQATSDLIGPERIEWLQTLCDGPALGGVRLLGVAGPKRQGGFPHGSALRAVLVALARKASLSVGAELSGLIQRPPARMADFSTTTEFGNCSLPASKITSPTATCSKPWAHAGHLLPPPWASHMAVGHPF